MKSLVIISCFFIVATVVNANKNYRAYAGKDLMNKCIKTAQLTPEEVSGVDKDEFIGDMHKIGCFHGCILENIKVLKNNEVQFVAEEKVLEDMFKNERPERAHKTRAVIRDCANKVAVGIDDCAIGIIMAECIVPQLKAIE